MMDVDVYFRTCQITKFYDFPTKSDIGILFCIHNIFRDNFQPKFRLVLPTESGKFINVFVQLADNPQTLPFYIIYRLILATAIPCTPIGRLRAQYSVSQMRLSTSGNRKRLDTEQLRQFIGAIVVGYHAEIAVTIGGESSYFCFQTTFTSSLQLNPFQLRHRVDVLVAAPRQVHQNHLVFAHFWRVFHCPSHGVAGFQRGNDAFKTAQ